MVEAPLLPRRRVPGPIRAEEKNAPVGERAYEGMKGLLGAAVDPLQVFDEQQLQAERGRAIFETLVTEALGEYANIYP
jgi:hypothetical protein